MKPIEIVPNCLLSPNGVKAKYRAKAESIGMPIAEGGDCYYGLRKCDRESASISDQAYKASSRMSRSEKEAYANHIGIPSHKVDWQLNVAAEKLRDMRGIR